MIYIPIISAIVEGNNHQTVTKFASVLFNTKAKALNHDGHLSTFMNVIFASFLQHNKSTKRVVEEKNMIMVVLLQAVDVFLLSKIHLKE